MNGEIIWGYIMKLFASIYIGTYEVTMKVFEIHKDKPFYEIDCMKMQTDIIRDVLEKGAISFNSTDRLCRILNDMKRTFESYKVDGYSVFVGPNIRQASNELFVLEQIKLRTGLKVQVISNSEQRFLGYEAVASMEKFNDYVNDSAVLVDVGGMSLQITLFVKGKIVTTQQLLLGTVSVGENLKKLDTVTNSVEQAYEMMYKEIDVFKTMFLRDIEPKYMILLGDQVNLVSSVLALTSDKNLKLEDYLSFLNNIDNSYIRQLENKFNISFDNTALVKPFVMLHKAIASTISPKTVIVPGLSVCDGIAYDYSFKKKWISSKHDFEADVVSAAWAIAKRYGSYQPHLKALFKLSDLIFDAMKKYHGMTKREKLLMETIAILHDCGKYISISDASDCSYTIIMSSEILGLSHKEREIIAYTVAFNRKPLEPYENLSDKFTPEEYVIIVKLLAILKVANALDRSHKQKLKNVDMNVKDSKLYISIESNASYALEKGLFSKNADFFEQIFSIKPVLKEKKINS